MTKSEKRAVHKSRMIDRRAKQNKYELKPAQVAARAKVADWYRRWHAGLESYAAQRARA